MNSLSAPLKVAICLTGLTIAFWSGRVSSPDSASANASAEPAKRSKTPRPSRSQSGTGHGKSAPTGVSTPGAGQEAVRSISHLTDIMKDGGSMGVGSIQIALSRMSSKELENLAVDLDNIKSADPNRNFHHETMQIFARWAEVNPRASLSFAKSCSQALKFSALITVLNTIARNDPSYALNEAKKLREHSIAQSAQVTILRFVAKTDPDLWINTVLSNPSLVRSMNIYDVAAQWAEEDPAAAIARISKLAPPLQKQAFPQIAFTWASKDPAAAMEWAQSLDNTTDRNSAMSSIIVASSNKNPQEAMSMLDSLPANLRQQSLAQIYKIMAKNDFNTTIDTIMALPNKGDQYAALRAILGKATGYSTGRRNRHYDHLPVSYDIKQLQSLSAKLPHGELRDIALHQIATQLDNQSETETNQTLSNFSEKDRNTILSNLMQSLSYKNPNRALEIYEQLPYSPVNAHYYSSILSNIAKNEPEKAMQLALQKTTTGSSSDHLRSVISTISSQDPELAASYLDSIKNEKHRNHIISYTAKNWGQRDPDAALAWANKLPAEDQKRALQTIVPSIASQNPERAGQLLNDLMNNGDAGLSNYTSTASSVASTWGNIDPAAASVWVNNLPDGEVQSAAVKSLISNWVKRDSDQAGKWLDTFPDGDTRDSGVASLVSVLDDRDPETAFSWANTISKDQSRIDRLRQVISQWKHREPEKARSAIDNANLTDTERARLLKYFK